ncbi:fimbrial protein [Gallibacterium genomosp. 3]|uniref:Fimbrial protein n=1 Tax=Gallibacterium genomosp. 3 TaxID=505345 RepID=A0A1A7PSH4_9PAST|nr:fimbria/pilus outer membrane usher protein [Gallibacterium genomosp. 3]OBX04105.1 fimbrial protein [Gallibacterium genomosp. 3]
MNNSMLQQILPSYRKYARTLLCISILASCYRVSLANDFAEFDAAFLNGNIKQSIDISRFSYGNPIPAGNYVADVYVNSHLRGRINLRFADFPKQKQAVLCRSETLLALLDLKPEAVIESSALQDDCQSLQLVPEAKVNFDISTLQLNIDLPQALVEQRPVGYISPAQWQDGVPVAFVRYDASQYRYRYGGETETQKYVSIDAGVNLFGWSLHHRGSLSWQDNQRLPYQRVITYAQRDVPFLRGQLTVGDFYTRGGLLDSFPLRGIQITSDERMLATSLRGYAPIIRGTANSNAHVTIRQNGNILREVNVPPGAFEIDDLYPDSYAGDIQVEVLEANGERHSFIVPYTAVAELVRPGYSRYQVSVGRYRYDNKFSNTKVGQIVWQYGLSNDITLNLGANLTKNYHAELVGLSFNTPIGAFATNAVFSNARFKNSGVRKKGYSLYASYNTHIEPTNTNVTVAAYRYSSKDYYSLHDVVRVNESEFDDEQSLDFGLYNYRPKNQFQISVNQPLKDGWGSTYLIGTTRTYWQTSQRQNEYQFGYSNSYKRLNYSIAFSQLRDNEGRKENQIYLNFSLPLGNDNPIYLSQTLTHSQSDGYASGTSLSGVLGKEYRYNYNLTFYKQRNNSSFSLNTSYYGSLARLGASWSQDNQHNQQMSMNISGAVVAHPKGITLSNDLSDNFAIIHAKGARGARIKGAIGNEIDYFGNGIVPYVDPYAINYIGIDTSEIPDRVELDSTEQEVIPRANSAILVEFSTKVGSVVFFELTNLSEYPPIGTEVFDQKKQSVGIVSQGGRIYTRGIANKGTLQLNWGEKQCQFDYQISDTNDNGQPLIIPVQCQVE